MILPILNYPNPLLLEKAEKINDVTSPEIKELILDMIETLENSPNGMALAATQVGRMVRLCVIKFDGKKYIILNPKIKSKSIGKEILEEGCLSFPGQFIPIKRHKKVTVSALDRNGGEILIKADGIFARALQHEIDHLDGVLILDRADKKNKKILLQKNEKQQ
ncbi:MAG TPA: peptide deformylase [Patescibacteria group bacterium]|nr:peptide deformylase [Patescibacteria group bacterium]